MINVGKFTRWWQLKYFLMFTPKIGEDDFHFDSYLFRWVGSTTNLIYHDHGSYGNVAKKKSTLTILTPPMERPDPPSDTPGASKKVFLTPHDIPRIVREVVFREKNQCPFPLPFELLSPRKAQVTVGTTTGIVYLTVRGSTAASPEIRWAPSLKLTFSHLKHWGWTLEDEFPFWEGYVARCYVGFGECSRFLEKKRVV